MNLSAPTAPVFEAVGVIHVHTTRSDGCMEPGPVLDHADAAGLDYLCFNDHNTLALAHEGWHGKRHGGVLSIVGAELQHTNRKSHLLVFGAEQLKTGRHILAQLEDLKASGALAIVAHPREISPRIPFFEGYPWCFGESPLLDGVEIWNWMSSWKGGVSAFSLRRRMNFPDSFVKHPDSDAVRFWFGVGGCAVGGADAHGHTILLRKVFSYGFLFDRVRTHLLLDQPLTDPSQLVLALRRRSCFISNAIAGDARGFRACAAAGVLRVELPGEGWITIIAGMNPPVHTGLLMAGTHEFKVSEGPVHIEVYRGGRTWISCSIA